MKIIMSDEELKERLKPSLSSLPRLPLPTVVDGEMNVNLPTSPSAVRSGNSPNAHKKTIQELEARGLGPLPVTLRTEIAPDIVHPAEVIISEKLGRPVGSEKMDPLTRELIAMDSGLGLVPQRTIAKLHDTTQAEVSFLGRAMNQTNIEGQKQDPELYARITQKKYNIIDTATSKLLDTLGLFEPSCLDQKQMPGAALSISAVIERLEGRANVNNAAPVSFHIYAPRTRHEDQYEVIQVNE